MEKLAILVVFIVVGLKFLVKIVLKCQSVSLASSALLVELCEPPDLGLCVLRGEGVIRHYSDRAQE